MMQFKAFKPEAMNKIAKAMGYSGNMGQFQQFIEQNPQRQQQMNMYTNAAKMMAQGGVVKMQTGGAATQGMPRGTVTNPQGTQAATPVFTGPGPQQGQPAIGQFGVEQIFNPGLPIGGTTIATQTPITAAQDVATGTGQLSGQVGVPTDIAATAQAQAPSAIQANLMSASQAAPAVNTALTAT